MPTIYLYVAVSAVCAFILSAGLTAFTRRYALRTQLLDVPNERSAHKTATPRGGGLGFVITISLYFLLMGIVFAIPGEGHSFSSSVLYLCVGVGGVLTATIGWLDDRHSVSASKRLAVHFLSALIAVAPFFSSELGAIQIAFTFAAVIFIAGLINFYNFMDGIDGIAGVEAVTAALGLALINVTLDSTMTVASLAVVGAASLGFLVFNWPPAKIFMGDVGSGFLGFIFGAVGVAMTYQFGRVGATAVMIVLGVFIVDATVTLFDRALKGKKVWLAHSEHAYQNSARRWGHKPVTTAVLLINVFWLFPMAYFSIPRFNAPEVAILVAYAPLVVATLYLKRPVPVRSLL